MSTLQEGTERQKSPTIALKEFGLPVAGAVLDREGRGTLETPKSHAGSGEGFSYSGRWNPLLHCPQLSVELSRTVVSDANPSPGSAQKQAMSRAAEGKHLSSPRKRTR